MPESDQSLTFSGRSAVIVPPGAVVISDPIPFPVPADDNLAISFYFSALTQGAGIHYLCHQNNYIAPGDQTGAAVFNATAVIDSWAFLAGIDVIVPDGGAAIVVIGDSYTEGGQSTTDANHRWPNYLARRLLTAGVSNISVVNSAINANRILHDAAVSLNPLNVRFGVNTLARFDRDVFTVPGAKWVVLLIGAPDINLPGGPNAPLSETVGADDVIAGLEQMAARAHEMGLRVIGCTPMPLFGHPNYTPDKDVQRNVINDWIRNTDVFDAMLDFDMALRDPDQPNRLLPAYDNGEHIHPGDAGYEKMASIIDLKLFQ